MGAGMEHQSRERTSSCVRVVKQRLRDLRVGRVIAVVFNGRVQKARILRGGGSLKIYYRLTSYSTFFTYHVLTSDEGMTWVRDWNSKATDALRTAVAL